ncbi:hypothetical protein M9H77_04385 [Catharanthus roseus]|uniref:Uncharacterized protein n=1 Tax=Catharanthus roseus TaxID=4058 RepID=A0ACC0CE86_CATRO|nr:hypothetical protein M9H77_04385 [Catharanthus roseus]
MKSRLHILDVPLVDIPFQEEVDIAKTSRIGIDVPDIGTLLHELGKLESVDICGRNSIVDEDENNEDEEKVKWESDEEEEDEEFQSKSDFEMVCGSKKKKAHSEMSTPPAATSISPRTSVSQVAMSTPPVTLTLFLQLQYSSLAPISTPSFSSSATGTSSRLAPSLLAPGENGHGICIIKVVCPTASAKGTAKYRELKVNAERLHIETDLPWRLMSS